MHLHKAEARLNDVVLLEKVCTPDLVTRADKIKAPNFDLDYFGRAYTELDWYVP